MDSSQILTENKKASTKFLAVVFGYLFIGLFVTALVGFVYAYFIAATFRDANGAFTEQGITVILVSGIAALVLSYVDSFVMLIVSAKSGKAPWVGYILYAVCMGIFMSLLLLAGVDFYTMGEAFGITAACFGVMFLIGYFSPVDLSPLAFVGLALLIGILLVSMVFGIWYLIAPSSTLLLDYLISLGIIVVAMLFTGYDANQMGRIAEKGMATNNVALYCAFSLYSDFIILFTRILYILLATKNRN